jgi:hypothetical protein
MGRVQRLASVGSMVAVCAGCGSAPAREEATTSQAVALTASDGAAPPVLTFASNFTQAASGPLVAGQVTTIAYDPTRLVAQCGGSAISSGGGGGFSWGISGYYALGSAPVASFPVTITESWASGNAVFTPPAAGQLAIWFGCGNSTGQIGWDSDYGQNYHFPVQAPSVDAGTDAGAATGTVSIQVLGDAVQGSAGSVPPDQITSAPLGGVQVWDGPSGGGTLLGQTDANGDFTATLPLGVHAIGVSMVTSDDSMFSSDGNAVIVATAPATLAIHVIPDTIALETTYDAGEGSAIYLTGETSALGNWTTAYKFSYDPGYGGWQLTTHIPAGAQFKLLLGPWVDGSTVPTDSAGLRWETGANHVTPASSFSALDLGPSF